MPGPHYFAWVDYTTGGIPAFGPEHQVEDEEVISYTIDQKEGDAATLNIDVRNPKVGLLAPGRPLWAYLSFDTATTAGIIPLFFGRLVGIPTNILAEVVTLSFVAKPLDFTDQKFALAETLKVLPWYDPIFIDPKLRPSTDTSGQQTGDPDVVLEGYSQLWAIDRLTLELSTSDILNGEDGLEVFTPDEFTYDSLQIELGEPPLTSVHVAESVNWSQAATGSIDFGERWFDCWTGGSIISGWPQKGSSLAGGWLVEDSFAIDVYNTGGQQSFPRHFAFENKEKTHTVGDVMSVQLSYSDFPVGGSMFISDLKRQAGVVPSAAVISYDDAGVASNPYAAIDTEAGTEKAIPLHMSYNQVMVCGWLVHTKLVLGYNAGGKRNETADFTLVADLQEIVTLPDTTEVVETLELNGTDVGLDIDGSIPIVDTTRNAYFPTDRGQLSLEYGILRARAHILMRARAVNLSWDCTFDRAIQLTCRKSAQISDPRIPGGTAEGKVIAYSIKANVEEGIQIGNVTIGCAIGHAGTVATAAGDPDYVQAGYVTTGYQSYTGTVSAAASTDVGYSVPVIGPGPLITQLSKDQVVVDERIDTTALTAPIQVGSDTDSHGNTVKTFATFPITSYYLELLPLDKMSFDNLYDVNVTTLNIPKGIDLEAATTL